MPITHVTFVLDQSGSMESIADDTIGGFNSYLDSLSDISHGYVEFSLVLFDSNAIEKRYVGVPVASVARLSRDNYKPGASTPLIDAAYKSITATRDAVKEPDAKVIVVIQTDGHENSSTQYTFTDLSALVKELTAKGWLFVFLGAGIDAFDAGAKMGIQFSNTASYSRDNSRQTFSTMSAKTAMFRATGDAKAMDFTEQERKNMAGDTVLPTTLPPVARQTLRPNYGGTKAVDDFDLKR